MGITISGPSTQIPTNVVEVGNEISQNQLNAITASNNPSTGNPMQTLSALQSYYGQNIAPAIAQRVILPSGTWNHPFPEVGNFVLTYRNGQWWPWSQSGTVLASTITGTASNSYNFDFVDQNSNTISLNGSATVGDQTTNYNALGYWDNNNQTTYSSSSGTNWYGGTGPSYASNWDNPVASSGLFYDGMNWMYRYVYLDGSGGFYTADNANNPPY